MITYTGTLYGFPNDDVPPKEKLSKKWQLAAAMSMWSRYCNNSTLWGYTARQEFMLFRLYSDGRQPPDKYKDWFAGEKKVQRQQGANNNIITQYLRKGYANVDYSIDSPASSFKRTIQSILSNSDYRVRANSISTSHVKEKERKKWEKLFDAQYKKLRQQSGLPIKPQAWEPRNEQEAELYQKLGGIKLTYEMAIEDICQHVFDISDWKSIRLKCIEDLIDINFIEGKVYIDPNSGATKIKHVSPQNTVMSWLDGDSDNPTFIGYLEKMRLCDVRQTLMDQGYTPEEIVAVANKYYAGGNYNMPWQFFTEYDPNTERWRWEDMTVDVFHYQYTTVDLHYYTGRQKVDGTYVYMEEEDRIEKKNYADGRKRKTDKISKQTIYSGKYIIGTDIVYDIEELPNVMRQEYHRVQTDYFFERVAGKAITQELIHIYDSLMLTRLKLQAAKWAAAPKGFAIDIAALSNITIGDAVQKPLDLIKIRRQNGIQLYKSVIQQGKVITSQGAIQELDGGIGPQLMEWITCYQDDMQNAMRLSGISQALMGGSAINPEKGLGVTEFEIDATNHALYPLREGLKQYKDKAAKAIVLKTIVAIRNDKTSEEYWRGAIGDAKVDAILAVGNTTLEELSITLESTPSEGMKAKIQQMAEISAAAGRDGRRGISNSDYIYVLNLLDQDELKLAQLYLAMAEEREWEKTLTAQRQMQQENGQIQTQSAIQIEQAKVQSEQTLVQLRVQEYAAKANIDVQKETRIQAVKNDGQYALQILKGEQTLEEISLEGLIEQQTGAEITGKV